jgi:hypothetical protein
MNEDAATRKQAELVGERLVDEVRQLAPDEHDCEDPSRRNVAVANEDVRDDRDDRDDEMLNRKHSVSIPTANGAPAVHM